MTPQDPVHPRGHPTDMGKENSPKKGNPRDLYLFIYFLLVTSSSAEKWKKKNEAQVVL